MEVRNNFLNICYLKKYYLKVIISRIKVDSLVARLTPADLVVVILVDTLRVLIRTLTCIAVVES